MMHARRSPWFAAALVVLAACSASSSSEGTGGSSGGSGGAGGSDVDASRGSSGDDAASSGDNAGGRSDAATSKDASEAGMGNDGATLGCGAGLSLCDGFEGATLDAATWSLDTNQGSVTLDTSRAHSGSRSAHVHIESAGDARAYLVETRTFPAPADAFYARAFVYMNAPAPTVHATLFEGLQNNPVGDYSIGVQDQQIITNAYWSSPFSEGTHGGTTAMPTGRWACFEWHFDGSASSVHVFLDGAELVDAAAIGWHAPSFTTLELGLRVVAQDNAASAFDAWIDDVAVGSARIGCGP